MCGLCSFLIINPQTALYHTVWYGAMRCTITCGAVQLCHFAGSFCGLCGLCGLVNNLKRSNIKHYVSAFRYI